jgi:PadR family transcriptional regulator PadR
VVYPVLHSLEKKQLLKAKRKTIAGRNRVYYTVSPKGKKRMEELSGEWKRVKGGIDAALGEQHG